MVTNARAVKFADHGALTSLQTYLSSPAPRDTIWRSRWATPSAPARASPRNWCGGVQSICQVETKTHLAGCHEKTVQLSPRTGPMRTYLIYDSVHRRHACPRASLLGGEKGGAGREGGGQEGLGSRRKDTESHPHSTPVMLHCSDASLRLRPWIGNSHPWVSSLKKKTP